MKKTTYCILCVIISVGCLCIGYLAGCELAKDVSLVITVRPAEAGSVTPRTGTYKQSQELGLKASPNDGWVFSHWEGDIEGDDNPAVIAMFADMAITAVFTESAIPATGLTFDSWIPGSISVGETLLFYFDATSGAIYNIFSDDADGSGSHDSVIRVSAYREDLETAYFSATWSAYDIPQQITAAATERVYIELMVEIDFAGTFALMVEDDAVSAAYYYFETFPNGSGDTADTVMYLYDDGLTQIDVNDDGGGGTTYSSLKTWLESGTAIYIRIVDPYSFDPEFYSIRVSDAGFGGSSIGTAGAPDSYEPNDDNTEATPLTLNVVQDHSLTTAGVDADWFSLTAP
jgi:hypothetical protein